MTRLAASLPCAMMLVAFACVPYRFISESGQYRPEVPQPSQERINELAQLPPDAIQAAPLPAKMRLEVSPPMAIEGRPVEVRCFVPRNPLNRGVLVATAEQSMIRELGYGNDQFLFVLPIAHAACGQHEVVCAVERADRSIVRRSVRLTVYGECNADTR